MIPKACKRLAEVDFPIAVVSRHAAKEKSIRQGHPSTLHLWWARRPLASSRAVLLALLLPDPCDPLCPPGFNARAHELLAKVGCARGNADEQLRAGLLKFIGEFADWDVADSRVYLEVGRGLVRAAHGDVPPLVVDPFAGGGSIPFEALRLGCDAFASDLNPVACLILKMMIEDIPRHGPKLVDELNQVGAEIKRHAESEFADLYPLDPDGALPIAYLWARTVRCEAPDCGAEIPIFKSPWLSRKGATKARYFREEAGGDCAALIVEDCPVGGPARFRIAQGHGSENAKPGFTLLLGTKAKGNNANVVCPCCGAVLPGTTNNPRTRVQLSAQRGCADVAFDAAGRRIGGALLLAVVTTATGTVGRRLRQPEERDYQAVRLAQSRLSRIIDEWDRGGREGPCPVPDEPLPFMSGTFNVPLYGMTSWGDLFTARQKVVLTTLVSVIRATQCSEAAKEIAGLALSRLTDIYNALAVWETTKTQVRNLFSRQAIPMRWDFAEASALGGQAGDFLTTFGTMQKVVERMSGLVEPGQVQPEDATESPLPDATASVWFTDPPYYFAVPYADLSDYFFVWLKRALPDHQLVRDPFDSSNPLTPKTRELCEMAHWDPARYSHKDRDFFEEGMRLAFAEGRRVLADDGVGAVVFAHKTTDGWEALLSGMIRGGWTITGSWPIATEMATRLRARESAALATSVHLVCRPRPVDADVGDWADVLRELPMRVGDWMERLQSEGVRGADLVFACIGPALEVFSRYSTVETAEGREVVLAEYLEKVWEAVGRSALAEVLGTADARARNGSAGAVEEDARLTALFLWTLQSTDGQSEDSPSTWGEEEESTEAEEEAPTRAKSKGFTLVFDVVRRFAQPLGIDLPTWEGRVIETKKGAVRLLPVGERARQLFGDDGAQAVAARLEEGARTGSQPQLELFPGEPAGPPRLRGRTHTSGAGASDEDLASPREATTLDRVHAAMLLQAAGRTNALRALLSAEQERGQDFLRLANALSALYPRGSEEKRLLDAMLLAMPR